jgi:predicted metal-binding membrane protein
VTAISPFERVLRNDRLVALAGIAFVVLLAWGYLLAGAGIDMSMAGMEMDPMPWAVDHALIVFIMWWVMMIAMMVPSAAPTILLFSTIKRKQEPSGRTSMEAYIFLSVISSCGRRSASRQFLYSGCSKVLAGCPWK